MMNYLEEYDETDPISIETYAKRLIGKTFADVCKQDDITKSMVVRETTNYEVKHENKKRKGGLGELIEERFFHYQTNNDARPDFDKAGVELKVTPYKQNKNGTLVAKERLILTMIDYFSVVDETFENSHMWQKARLILLVYYLYQQEIGYTDTLEEECKKECMENAVLKEGFFAETFPVNKAESTKIKIKELPIEVGEVSETFQCAFENSGIMKDGIIYTMKTVPNYHGKQITLGDVMETGQVEEQYFIPEEKLYYTDQTVTHSDETEQRLPKEDRQTWQYLKGAKKLLRTSSTGHEYVFSEGAISMIDQEDKPARTMLTSEGGFSRTTHIVKDKMTGRVRLLTATEAERIQGFPTNHTKYCLVKGETVEMPLRKRRFMMGNAYLDDGTVK